MQAKTSTLIFWLTGALSFMVRAYINFSSQLRFGNGGYYPVQVRALLERGELAFPDMPFLFYLDAGIVKLCSLLGFPTADALILNVVMFVDALSVPLLLIPLYYWMKKIRTPQFYPLQAFLPLFATLSFYTLMLAGSSQKNGLGITFLFAAVTAFFYYNTTRRTRHLVLSVVFFVLIGLTHFGTFSFALLFLILFLAHRYRAKAIIPVIALFLLAVAFIYLWDTERSLRLLSLWSESFRGMPHPLQLISMVIYGTLGILFYRVYRKNISQFSLVQRRFVWSFIALLILVPLPVLSPQFTSRLSSFLFVPIIGFLVFSTPYIQRKWRIILSILLLTISVGSSVFMALLTPPKELTPNELSELKTMRSFLDSPENSVIVARHNLEFWVAWAMEVDVCQESKLDKKLQAEYTDIYVINQNSQKVPDRKNRPQRNHMDEPLIPEHSTLVYTSDHFKLYKIRTPIPSKPR